MRGMVGMSWPATVPKSRYKRAGQGFDGTILNMKHVGSFIRSRDRVLLAHWDTRPFADKDSLRQREPIDGANDGGSA